MSAYIHIQAVDWYVKDYQRRDRVYQYLGVEYAIHHFWNVADMQMQDSLNLQIFEF